jgi:hypothetical protein
LAEQQEEQTYDRWSRTSALSTRGYVLAVLIPVLIAACGFGAVSVFASDDHGLSGTTVRLPVSGYAPEGSGDGALIQGVLRLDADHCVYLESGQDGADPGKIWAVWPATFKAAREGARLTIYDDGKPVAHDGDTVQMSGGSTPVGTFAGEPCLPDSGDVAVVQSDVTVVR